MGAHGAAASVSALVSICLVTAACSRGPVSTGLGQISVVANFYPIAQAAAAIGGDRVHVTNLTAPGVEPHDLELTPDLLTAIATADVVLYVGGGFQPAVQDAVVDARGPAVDVTADIRSLPPPPGEGQSLTADPHVWLDPSLYARVVANEEEALAAASPENADVFARNAAAYEAKLAVLDAAYRTGLARCARDLIVTSHAAFGYLAKAYGLRQEAISGLSPDAEPSPQRLADLKALVERDGVTTIFTEELVSPKVAQTLADETGAGTATLNPLESLTPDQIAAGDDYLSVMRQNLVTLRTALGCA